MESLRAAFFGRGLPEFSLDQRPLERGQEIDEKLAVEVIDFVTEGAGQKIPGLDPDRPAFKIESRHHDSFRAFDLLVDFRDGQAAFLAQTMAFGLRDFGVDQDMEGLGILADGEVDDDQAPADINLRCGQTDSGLGVHGLDHILGQPADFVVDGLNGQGLFRQGRVPDDEYGSNGNVRIIPQIQNGSTVILSRRFPIRASEISGFAWKRSFSK
jgi:hypothetical protein